ncbi:MAG TPA: thioesterase domain-containing protein [Coleofasciculaceae cyanobacterium]
MTQIWEKVLGIKAIGIHNNFFDLGGHSLLAVKLFAQIEKVFKINLPLVTLFQSPTVEELAKVLRQQGWKSSWYSLVPIQPTASRPTLFGIHFLVFQDLSRYLGQDQPVYGLRYGMAEPTNTVVSLPKMEDLAAHYIQQMRLLQPEGPYFLMGLCMGGVIAYEMAQQLDAQGQQVALLALCDSFLGNSSKVLPPLQILSNLLRQGPAGWLKLLNLWITHKLRLLRHGNQYHLAHIDNNDALLQMKKDYTPKPYSGRVTLFKATEKRPSIRYDSSNSPEVEWIKLVNGELEVHQIPGNHHTMLMEPGIQQLAATLQDCIDRALAETHIKH